MSTPDSDHWLWRLSTQEWLAAAQVELDRGYALLGSRRSSVTHARRAVGMALNGVLVALATDGWTRERCETAWGRSYADHIRVLASATTAEACAPFELGELGGLGELGFCARCRELLAIPVMPPTGLVNLARTKDEAARAALELAAALVRECAARSAG